MFDLVSSAAKRDPKIAVPGSSAFALSIPESEECPHSVPSPLPLAAPKLREGGSNGRGEGQGLSSVALAKEGEVRVLNDGQPN
jgi:hypothetical protein